MPSVDCLCPCSKVKIPPEQWHTELTRLIKYPLLVVLHRGWFCSFLHQIFCMASHKSFGFNLSTKWGFFLLTYFLLPFLWDCKAYWGVFVLAFQDTARCVQPLKQQENVKGTGICEGVAKVINLFMTCWNRNVQKSWRKLVWNFYWLKCHFCRRRFSVLLNF